MSADDVRKTTVSDRTGREWEDGYFLLRAKGRGAKAKEGDQNNLPLQQHADIPCKSMTNIEDGPAWFTKLTDNQIGQMMLGRDKKHNTFKATNVELNAMWPADFDANGSIKKDRSNFGPKYEGEEVGSFSRAKLRGAVLLDEEKIAETRQHLVRHFLSRGKLMIQDEEYINSDRREAVTEQPGQLQSEIGDLKKKLTEAQAASANVSVLKSQLADAQRQLAEAQQATPTSQPPVNVTSQSNEESIRREVDSLKRKADQLESEKNDLQQRLKSSQHKKPRMVMGASAMISTADTAVDKELREVKQRLALVLAEYKASKESWEDQERDLRKSYEMQLAQFAYDREGSATAIGLAGEAVAYATATQSAFSQLSKNFNRRVAAYPMTKLAGYLDTPTCDNAFAEQLDHLTKGLKEQHQWLTKVPAENRPFVTNELCQTPWSKANNQPPDVALHLCESEFKAYQDSVKNGIIEPSEDREREIQARREDLLRRKDWVSACKTLTDSGLFDDQDPGPELTAAEQEFTDLSSLAEIVDRMIFYKQKENETRITPSELPYLASPKYCTTPSRDDTNAATKRYLPMARQGHQMRQRLAEDCPDAILEFMPSTAIKEEFESRR